MVAETAERLEVWKVALSADSTVESMVASKVASKEYSTAVQMVGCSVEM